MTSLTLFTPAGVVAKAAPLKLAARRLQALVRQHDVVVRWGGEEFVLVLPGTSADGMAVLAERVLKTIADSPVTADGRAVPPLMRSYVLPKASGPF